MPQTEIAKKHHFIPEFYLRRWASKGQVVEFRKQYRGVVKAKPKFPAGTGYTMLGYALRGFPPETASALEELYFKPVDTKASLALAKMETGASHLTFAERVAWAQFVLSLVHRQPERIEQMRSMLEMVTLQISKAEQRRWKRERRSNDPISLADAIRADWARDDDKRHRNSLELMTNTINSELLNGHLVRMHWGTLSLPLSCSEILTSDRPVQWYAPMSDDRCHILLPIGPKRVFWAVNTVEMALTIQSHPASQLVSFLNEQTVRRAMNCVYGMSQSHLGYVQDFMGIDPQPNQGDAAYALQTPKRLKAMRRQEVRAQKAERRGRR